MQVLKYHQLLIAVKQRVSIVEIDLLKDWRVKSNMRILSNMNILKHEDTSVERQEALLLKAENGLLFQALNKVDSLEKRIAELEQVIVALKDMLCCCMPDDNFHCDDRHNCPEVKNKYFSCPLVTIHSFSGRVRNENTTG